MADPSGERPPAAAALPAELEARIAALEAHGATADFDLASWLWIILLGIALPVLLIIAGWWA